MSKQTAAVTTAADDQARTEGTEVIVLNAADINHPDHTNVRPWLDVDGGAELERVKQLAKTIQQEGQLQPVVVIETYNGDSIGYDLVAGRRRVAAITYLNQHGDDRGVLATVYRGVDEATAFRRALIENTHRLNPSPMDLAMNISLIVDKEGWEGQKDWSKKVADFLGVSRATVTQHAKLLEAPNEIQEKVHSRELSADAALALMAVKPEKRKDVIEEAEKEAEKEEAARVESTPASTPATKDPKDPKPAKSKVTTKHVQEAIRKTEGAVAGDKLPKRTRTQLVDAIAQFDCDTYGYRNSPVRKFVQYFVDVYAEGGGGRSADSKLVRMFDGMLAGGAEDIGTPSKAEEKELEALAAENSESSKGKSLASGGKGGKPAAKKKAVTKSTKKAA